MRFILTADWQTQPANIPECEKAHEELKANIRKYKPDAVINLGDFKEHYDPIPGIVLKFWIRATREISEMIPYYALMGNHDRHSQSLTADNWMDAIAAAGARTITSPTYVKALHAVFIPYATREQTIAWADACAEKYKNLYKPTLFFHCEVLGARMGTRVSTTGVTPEELHVENYQQCFGGHIHEYQHVAENIWYVGSPFCMDWGEANQRKGVLLVDIDSDWMAATDSNQRRPPQLKQLKTSIPHWYDFDFLQETGKTPEPGAFVRVRVPVVTKKVTDELRAAEKDLLAQYGNINVFAVPEITRSAEDAEIIKKGATDDEMLTQYVSATLPEAARFKANKAITYMSKMLPPTPSIATSGVRFVMCKAHNVLCFEDIKIDYREQGLVMLRGVNRDWPKRSNGSGKTSALSLLPIAFSGQNLKGQKTDEWASEENDDTAWLKLWIESGSGKLFRIDRGRRPHKLLLDVDGVDMSTGIRGTGKAETQGRIEEMLGMDLRTLINSVYIDQTIANGFLFGTQKDRMDLMSKLLNLDRFAAALKAVSAEIDIYENRRTLVARKQESVSEKFILLKDQYTAMESETESSILDDLASLEKELDDLVAHHAELAAHAKFYEDLQETVDTQTHEIDEMDETLETLRAHILAKQTRIKAVDKLIAAGKCSQCGSLISALQQNELLELKEAIATDQHRVSELVAAKKLIDDKCTRNQTKLDKYTTETKEVERDLVSKRAEIDRLSATAERERERVLDVKDKRAVLRTRLQHLRASLVTLGKKHQALSVYLEMLIYAKSAFHRNGIPLALSMALCPVLNAAADEFSEIFNSGKVKIRFSVQEGDFDVEVINTAGSGKPTGQSVGESAMAGVICAFALREAAPRTNLLILDEPGHGLDAEGAKEFARGLLAIKDRYETIIVTTHSQVIEGVLGGETVWTVEKSNRVSKLIQ